MRIRDWSSDVCSSDLVGDAVGGLEFLDGCAVARVQLDENLHIEISSVTSVGSAPIQSTSGKMFADGQRANALSRQRKDRCGQRGENHRHADLHIDRAA